MTELQSFASCGVFQPGLYRQATAERAFVRLEFADLSRTPAAQRSNEVEVRIRLEAAYEFNLGEPPLLRATLLQVDQEEHFLILVVDHLVSDAWSMRILRKEFSQCYFCEMKETPLEDPPLSYSEYAVHQAEAAQDSGFARAIEYWRGQWSTYGAERIGFEHLPFALPQPEHPTNTFAAERACFDHGSSQAIRAFTRKARVTPYIFFLAIYGELLRTYTGRERFGIWGHFANRGRPGTQSTVGWFANTHLIGIEANPDSSLESRMLAIRRNIAAAYEHQEMPVMLLWRALGAYPRDPDARLLLDMNVADVFGIDGNHELSIRHASELTPVFGRFSNLGLYLRDDREMFQASVQYSVDRFPRAAMLTFLERFQDRVLLALRTVGLT
ncbi:MAG TPA: condensation domain-containing protein [Bryobacteraceae bacterium]|jgi:hypothetical protein